MPDRLPLVAAACLHCGAVLPSGAPGACPACGATIRPLGLERTLGELAAMLRGRDAVLVLVPTPEGLRATLVDGAGEVSLLSVPAGAHGEDVRPVAMLSARLKRNLGAVEPPGASREAGLRLLADVDPLVARLVRVLQGRVELVQEAEPCLTGLVKLDGAPDGR